MFNVEVFLSVSGSVVDNTFLFISDIILLTSFHSYINQLTRDGKIDSAAASVGCVTISLWCP